ncbi:MAG: 4Fe-4S binding protein [Promethearchaeota archaeon]
MSQKEDEMWRKLARTIIRAGPLPFPVTDALLKLTKILVNKEQAKFLLESFGRPNRNLDQILKKIKNKYDRGTVEHYLNELMEGGVITGAPSRTTGTMVYYLMPYFPGLFEWSLLHGKKTAKEKRLAELYDIIFGELAEITQQKYDDVVDQFKNFPPMDRVVPVEQEISNIEAETILPIEELSKIIDENDTFCTVHCYCRQEKDLLGKPCKVTSDREICIMFGKTAQFCIDHNFGKQKTNQEIKDIMKKVEAQGLVHKALHTGLDPKKEITGFCNCCKCCCGIFELYYRGIIPIMSYTSFIAEVDEVACTACGTCEEKCPVEAATLINTLANSRLNKIK